MEAVTVDAKPVFVGLDYHSKSVQVCVVDAGGAVVVSRRCSNNVLEIARTVEAVGTPVRVAVEACCGAANLAQSLVDGPRWSVSLAHPGYVARMKHNPDKTDFADARMLAELCRAGFIPEVWLAPESIRELRIMVRFRFEQMGRRKTLKLRILAVLREQRVTEPKVGRWTKSWLRWVATTDAVTAAARWMIDQHLAEITGVDARINEVEQRLAERTADDPVVQKLLMMTGIGPVTAWTMRAVIGRFDRFRNGKQLARFCALTPKNSSSGQRQADAGLIKAGDPALKCVLIQAAQRLRRHEPRWRELFSKLRSNGKPTCVAIAAVANRWVRWLQHELATVPQAA